MKRLIILIVIFCYSCVNEVALPIKVDFITQVVDQDYTVPVKVKISNYTEGADTYSWTFEGAIPGSSINRNPGTIVYEQPGNYTIKLEASNRDGSREIQEVNVNVKPPVNIGFTAEVVENNFSPVEVKLINTTTGATSYDWAFQGGNPSNSTNENPENVTFTTPGSHTITLKVTNGEETYTKQETIDVAPYLIADFNYDLSFEDDDLQVPVTITTTNSSISATSYEWTVSSGVLQNTTSETPTIVFTEPGTHTITLKASNGKDEKTITKTITVLENTNLRVFENIQLGINTAHKANTKGAFFSTKTRKVYTKNEVTNENGNEIDIIFFGLDSAFTFNKFVSPIEAQNNSFESVPNATNTLFINLLENCNCTDSLSVAEFNAMQNDEILANLSISTSNVNDFNNVLQPRIVLFKTQDGRKGAIKIKEFVNNGTNSYIVVDIKVQKETN